MYIPEKYRLEDPVLIREFLESNAFGLLVSNGEAAPLATHLPLEIEPGPGPMTLFGHFAKANPQWRQIKDGQQVLCIFQGAHSYVSSSWYEEEEVPTWNYIAAHVQGSFRFQDAAELRVSLGHLMDKYERDSERPVTMVGLSAKTLRQVRGIVGFTVTVDRVDVALKLSQGRELDHGRIMEELTRRGGLSAAVAAAMKRYLQP
ncbi:FMN-binding negative transcriptional regulator [Robiginitalea sp. SC105]|uniref:FMN-binding negative transcriptional regulator n=1 Tax=Robiginitalea sp. SC105 TaxID=2762332 RepID=UPI00163A52CC|nr:FMN-binding negative transcriptional regulator [Robiginitalea sp. SC105]MBC2839365.1 FMN-binding negative transcriptional regulator [Robiginitalea sp. SC105]